VNFGSHSSLGQAFSPPISLDYSRGCFRVYKIDIYNDLIGLKPEQSGVQMSINPTEILKSKRHVQ